MQLYYLSEFAHADLIVGHNFIDLLVIRLPTSNQLQMQNSYNTLFKTSGQVDAESGGQVGADRSGQVKTVIGGQVEWNTQATVYRGSQFFFSQSLT